MERYLVGPEDVILLVGLLLISVGSAFAFGWPYGLIVAGSLLIAYGVWTVSIAVRNGKGD